MKISRAIVALIAPAVVITTPAYAGPADPLGSRFDPRTPTAFNQAQAQGFASTFTSCLAPTIGSAISSATDSCERVTLATNCPDLDLTDQDPQLSCEMLIAGGRLNTRFIERMSKQQTDVACALKCKNAKLKLVSVQLKCLGDQSTALAQQIGSVQQSFTSNFTRMQQDIQQMQSAERERQAQLVRTNELLNGKEGTKQPGLIDMRNKLQEAIAAMPQRIRGLKEQQRLIESRQKLFREQVAAKKMAKASDCMSKDSTVGSYRCTPNGPLVPPIEYMLCRYEQEQTVGARGTPSRDENVLKRAQAARAAFESFLTRMFSQAPRTQTPPTNAQEAAQNLEGAFGRYQTPKALLDAFGPQLARFDSRTLGISRFARQMLNSCYREAQAAVDQEVSRPGNPSPQNPMQTLADIREQILENDRSRNTAVNEAMTEWAQTYTDAVRTLTGVNLPVGLELYRNAKPEVQAGFLDAMQKNMEAALRGTPAVRVPGFENAMTNDFDGLVVEGANAAMNIRVECQGLDQCITKLNNLDTNLKKEIARVGEEKTKYVAAANANVEAFANTIAQNLNQQACQLNSRVDELNQAMASAGAEPSLRFDDVESETLEPDERLDGLMRPPGNALNYIGSKMTCRMKKVSGEAFTTAGSAVKEAQRELAQKLARIKNSQTELASRSRVCLEEQRAKVREALEKSEEDLAALNCSAAVRNCGNGNNRQPVETLLSVIRSLGGDDLDPDGVFTGLETGINVACGDADSVPVDCRDKAAQELGLSGPPREPPATCPSGRDSNQCRGDEDAYRNFQAAVGRCTSERSTTASKCRGVFSGLAAKARRYGRSAGETNPLEGDAESGDGE